MKLVSAGITSVLATAMALAQQQSAHQPVEIVATPPETTQLAPVDVPPRWEFRTVHSDQELTAAVADGWEFVSMGADSSYLVKRWTGKTVPILKSKVEPRYTKLAYQRRIQGNVLLGLVVGTDGIAKNLSVVRSLDDGLDASAMDAVKQWRFEPAKELGKPIEAPAQVSVAFRVLSIQQPANYNSWFFFVYHH